MDEKKVRLVMRSANFLILFWILSFTFLQNALAHVGVAFSSGQGIQNIVPYRLSLLWDFGPIVGKEALWGLNLVWENSAAIWNGPRKENMPPSYVTDLNAATTGPMLRWQRQAPYALLSALPYSELGVGLSWLSKTEIEGRKLSLHFQFEDKFGVGMRFGKKQQYDVAVRAYHYSNCSIKRPNSGVNLAMASFGVWFPK